MRSVYIMALFMVLSGNGSALELDGVKTQGSLLRGKVEPGTQVWLNDKPVKVLNSGSFVIGFGRDANLTQQLSWQSATAARQTQQIILSQRHYDVQKIEGVPQKMVTPPKDVLSRIRQDNVQVAQARSRLDERSDVFQSFIWPAKGPISGVYGSQRVFNGTPKRPHFGVDVAAPVGTPVYAPADGIVTLWVPDMYYSGGTMVIDHGLGVSSTFLHLSAGHVAPGDVVKQGQLVAEIGDTGRVTGAHLDWRLNWLKERLDPALLVPAR